MYAVITEGTSNLFAVKDNCRRLAYFVVNMSEAMTLLYPKSRGVKLEPLESILSASTDD